MTLDSEPLVSCQCRDCECTNTTGLLGGEGDTSLCACCYVDCPHVHGPDCQRPEHYKYYVDWSDEDGEFLGRAGEFPSLSFVAPAPHEALAGIKPLVSDALCDMVQTGESPPAPDAALLDDGAQP
ncbi:hypothetical protein [Mycolicibacterium helvum]|nr:hypothetical protein [Mycolicibacterium helvum]